MLKREKVGKADGVEILVIAMANYANPNVDLTKTNPSLQLFPHLPTVLGLHLTFLAQTMLYLTLGKAHPLVIMAMLAPSLHIPLVLVLQISLLLLNVFLQGLDVVLMDIFMIIVSFSCKGAREGSESFPEEAGSRYVFVKIRFVIEYSEKTDQEAGSRFAKVFGDVYTHARN